MQSIQCIYIALSHQSSIAEDQEIPYLSAPDICLGFVRGGGRATCIAPNYLLCMSRSCKGIRHLDSREPKIFVCTFSMHGLSFFFPLMNRFEKYGSIGTGLDLTHPVNL